MNMQVGSLEQLASDNTQQAEQGRLRADAQRNRDQLLQAARMCFAEVGPDVPLESIARRAGVGIGTLYRRFPDRHALFRAIAYDVVREVVHEAHLALAEAPNAFQALARYMHHALDAQIGAVMPMLAAQIPLDDAELDLLRAEGMLAVQKMLEAAQQQGLVRVDIVSGDISLLLMRLTRPLPALMSTDLDPQLAHRQLDLVLTGLRALDLAASMPLSGSAHSLAELRELASAHLHGAAAGLASASDPGSSAQQQISD